MLSRSDIQTQKFVSLSFSFLFKAMECICYERCSSQYCDFIKDDENWFSLQLYHCNTLRKKVIPTKFHGWFSIDILFKDSKMETHTIEKWSFLHVPYTNSEKFPDFQNLKDLKVQTYRNFSLALRSLYSIINALPAKSLSLALNNLKNVNKSHLIAEVSSWKSFPASLEGFKNHKYSQIKIPLVKTPAGKTLVVCKYRTNIRSLIPIFVVPPSENNDISLNKTSADTYFQSSSSFGINVQCSCDNLSPYVYQAHNLQSFIPFNNGNFDFLQFSNSINFAPNDSTTFFNFIENFQRLEYNDNYEINVIIKELNFILSLLKSITQINL